LYYFEHQYYIYKENNSFRIKYKLSLVRENAHRKKKIDLDQTAEVFRDRNVKIPSEKPNLKLRTFTETKLIKNYNKILEKK